MNIKKSSVLSRTESNGHWSRDLWHHPTVWRHRDDAMRS